MFCIKIHISCFYSKAFRCKSYIISCQSFKITDWFRQILNVFFVTKLKQVSNNFNNCCIIEGNFQLFDFVKSVRTVNNEVFVFITRIVVFGDIFWNFLKNRYFLLLKEYLFMNFIFKLYYIFNERFIKNNKIRWVQHW